MMDFITVPLYQTALYIELYYHTALQYIHDKYKKKMRYDE